jgi:hypothetical protein
MQTSLVIGTNEESIFTVRQILQGNSGTPRRAGLDGCTLTPGRQRGDDVTRQGIDTAVVPAYVNEIRADAKFSHSRLKMLMA